MVATSSWSVLMLRVSSAIDVVAVSILALNLSSPACLISWLFLLLAISVWQKASCVASSSASFMSFAIVSSHMPLTLTNGSDMALAAIWLNEKLWYFRDSRRSALDNS